MAFTSRFGDMQVVDEPVYKSERPSLLGVILPVVSTNASGVVANYTTVWATGGALGITLTLPPASANAYINIIKVDNSVGYITIEGDGAETINGQLQAILELQYESFCLSSDGIEWIIY